MAQSPEPRTATDQEGISHRVAQRAANRKLATSNPKPDAQGLVELACECLRSDCDRLVKVPLDVYARILEADHYARQAGHRAVARYRSLVSLGLMRIEERA